MDRRPCLVSAVPRASRQARSSCQQSTPDWQTRASHQVQRTQCVPALAHRSTAPLSLRRSGYLAPERGSSKSSRRRTTSVQARMTSRAPWPLSSTAHRKILQSTAWARARAKKFSRCTSRRLTATRRSQVSPRGPCHSTRCHLELVSRPHPRRAVSPRGSSAAASGSRILHSNLPRRCRPQAVMARSPVLGLNFRRHGDLRHSPGSEPQRAIMLRRSSRRLSRRRPNRTARAPPDRAHTFLRWQSVQRPRTGLARAIGSTHARWHCAWATHRARHTITSEYYVVACKETER
mmetsp:Transcript_43705/g.114871  ORF Transcript_43705/g.114871 Transcript_43705/m.114871 type:complete len:291 (-) Transcript_43705:248-1120(-)